MTLSALARTLGSLEMSGDANLSGIADHTDQVRAGDLFVCMPSVSRDTHQFIAPAIRKGASAVTVHSKDGLAIARDAGVAAWLPSDNPEQFQNAVWRAAKLLTGNPSKSMRLIGVTGTNGKTTTAWLLWQALGACGLEPAYLGTLGARFRNAWIEGQNTTPFPVGLQRQLASWQSEGVQAVAMEVSSHALAEHRVDGVEFDAAIFTNLTQDHLDFHGTMEAYEEAKLRLFLDLPQQSSKPFCAAINVDDPVGMRWAGLFRERGMRLVGFGEASEDVRCVPFDVGVEHMEVNLSFQGEAKRLHLSIGGGFNVSNVAATAAGMLALGLDFDQVVHALPAIRPAPGRFEPVPNTTGISVVVDYAHTPDALEKLLESLRSLNPRRIICVFGCGGDRDKVKRPLMARAVGLRADVMVVTSDNPRTEEPDKIIADVMAGVPEGSQARAIADRAEAVQWAVEMAEPGDVVVLAGKGHETYQIIGSEKFEMDDRVLAQNALVARR